ncbi:MAG: coiled-coil domain-containing protein [Collinsella intestinalis]
MSNSYKDGGTSMLTLLMAADSFDDLLSNSHYIEKVNDADKQVIGEIQTIRAELEQHKSTLESLKADLEALKEQQAQQLSVMQAKQAEVQQLVDGLSSDVRTHRQARCRIPRRRCGRGAPEGRAGQVPASAGGSYVPSTGHVRDRSSPWNASSPHAAPSRAPATACAPCGSPAFSLPPALAMWAATRTTCITATARAPTAVP